MAVEEGVQVRQEVLTRKLVTAKVLTIELAVAGEVGDAVRSLRGRRISGRFVYRLPGEKEEKGEVEEGERKGLEVQ